MAVIFSLRQEYFLQFLYTFDINFLNTNKDPEENLEGILSYKKHVTGKNGKDIWDNNILVCLGNKKIVGTEYNEMSRLCKQAFGEEAGSSIYEHFSGKSLIQQQIIFNIMEQETDDMASDEYLRCDIDYLMKRYYDVQLCSTKDFFNASRIMYLLSIGRSEGIAFTVDDLKAALCVFRDDEITAFENSLEALHKRHLIMKTKHNSSRFYEVSHDYIAQSFERYAETEMPTNVRMALDGFKLV